MRQVPISNVPPLSTVGSGRVAQHLSYYLQLIGLPMSTRFLGVTVDYVENHEEWRPGTVRLGDGRLIDNVPLGGH